MERDYNPYPDDMLIQQLGLPSRAFHALRWFFEDQGKPGTVGELRRACDAELLKLPNFGKDSLKRTRAFVPYQPDANETSRETIMAELHRLQTRVTTLERRLKAIVDIAGRF